MYLVIILLVQELQGKHMTPCDISVENKYAFQ